VEFIDGYLKNAPVTKVGPRLQMVLENWIARFQKSEPAWTQYPALQDGTLYASPLALPFLLSYAKREECPEWDWRLLNRAVESFLRHRLAKASTAREVRALGTALDNLDTLVPSARETEKPSDIN